MIEEEATSQSTESAAQPSQGHSNLTMVIVLILGVAVGIAIVLGFEALRASDDDNLVPVAQPAAVTTAPVIPAPSITPSPPAPDANDPLAGAVWPLPASETRYTDPVESARGFATDFVGFTAPTMGEFQVADSQSGEVTVKASDTGPTTIVFLRKLGGDPSWWVVGSASQNVIIQSPAVRATVDSPLTVSGQAKASGGNVKVELRTDSATDQLFAGTVTGGTADFAPFEASFEFTDPGTGGGALVATVPSAEDGSVTEAAVMRLFFDAG